MIAASITIIVTVAPFVNYNSYRKRHAITIIENETEGEKKGQNSLDAIHPATTDP